MASKKAKGKRRSGLGVNPLDILLDAPTAREGRGEDRQGKKTRQEKANEAAKEKDERVRKTRATYHLPVDLVEGLRDATLHLAGPPEFLSLSTLVEFGLWKELKRLWKKHNKGKPFPKRPHDLRGGRPVGS